MIRTPDFDAPYRLSFGSCRRSAPFDEAHLAELGADALVALAGRMVGAPHDQWPDILLLLGDQVYADDPSDEILARLRDGARGSGDPEVADEIQDFEEYTWLYHEAWTTPVVRWLLSTVPTGMLLDDHDLRDDWNTSLSWRRRSPPSRGGATASIGAYASYWVYQHLGNLSPEQLDGDDVYQRDPRDHRRRRAYRLPRRRRVGGGRRRRVDPLELLPRPRRASGAACGWSRSTRGARGTSIPTIVAMVDADEWAWVRRQVLEPADAVRPPRAGVDAAVPARCPGSTTSRAGTRRSPRARGAAPASGSARSSARRSTSSTGRRSASRSPTWPTLLARAS